MNAFKVLLIFMLVYHMMGKILSVGKERMMLTPEDVAWNTGIDILLIFGILYFFK